MNILRIHRSCIYLLALVPTTLSFSALLSPPPSPLHPVTYDADRETILTSQDGLDVGIPDLDTLFSTICQVSPAARQAIESLDTNDNNSKWTRLARSEKATVGPSLPWKSVQPYQPHRIVQQIEKIDNFQGHNAPLLRFRANIPGPCLPDSFARFIMDVDERKRWDTQIDSVEQIITLPFYSRLAPGTARQLGVGHCVTKAGFGISPREQLTLCGVQDMENGSHMMWGTELPLSQNHLLPAEPRSSCTRATSHVFAITLTPRDTRSFDVEYVLQLEIGGNIPPWLTTPIVIDSVRNMFRVADDFFSGVDGRLFQRLCAEDARTALPDGLLMSAP